MLVAGVACGHRSPLAIAQAAAGWGQEVLAGHGCRISPVTGRRVPPSASTLDRLGDHLDPDELEAALTGLVAGAALDPAAQSRAAAARAAARQHTAARQRRPHAADALRETRAGGWFRAAPGHPWLDPAVTGDPGHVPARVAVAVDGKERKLAKAGGKKKVHLLGAVTHVTGLVIGQDKVAKSGKANESFRRPPTIGAPPGACGRCSATGYPVGSLHRPCTEPCPGRARRQCSPQPLRQDNALGREHRNFSLKRASVRACCCISPAANCPRAGSEPGQGWGPGSTVSPPRCPGLRSA